MVTAAPAAKAALAEASRLWPRRRKASDGILPSAAHTIQNPKSDHERGDAWDLTQDPERGCDAHAQVRAIVARRDPRVKYAISNRRIWAAARASEGWRPYSGRNPHTSHAHVSLYAARRNDTSAWFGVTSQTAPAPRPAPVIEEDIVTDADIEKVAQRVAVLLGQEAGRMSLGGRLDEIRKAVREQELRRIFDLPADRMALGARVDEIRRNVRPAGDAA